ncbi:hypothetical protein FOXYSP1_18694 [Fusarium oxysporum f. sp. phaseoli]
MCSLGTRLMMLVSFGLGVLQRCVLVHGVIGQASPCWRSQNGMIRLPMQRSLHNRPVRCALVSPKVQAPPTRAVIH